MYIHRIAAWLTLTLAWLATLAGAQAGILSFASGSGVTTSDITFSLNPGQEGATLQASCSGCVTASSPANAVGVYNLSVNGFDISPTNALPNPSGPLSGASLPPGIYSQSFGGDMTISVSNSTATLVSGSCASITFFAQVGGNNAVLQCQFSVTPGSLVTLPAGTLYLIISGTTPNTITTASSCVPSITSSSQCPQAGEVEVTEFTGLTLDWYATLSSTPYTPENPIVVPNVVGQSQSQAGNAISGAGLSVETVTTQSSTTVPVGNVISQSPAAGASVPGGWPVDLSVSSGPPLVSVPNLTSDTESAAIAALKALGLTVTTVTSLPSSVSVAGQVTGQSPAAGTVVAPGSAVSLTVNGGPATLTQSINYTGDGTSSFNYSLYPSSPTFVEAFISPAENNSSSPYALFGNAAGGFDSSQNPVLYQMNYVDETTAVVCGAGPNCSQALSGAGTLTIISVNTCQAGALSATTCDSVQGALGAGFIYAGASLAAVNSNTVTQATFQLSYTPTQSHSEATGITTKTPQASQAYLIVSGVTVTDQQGVTPAPAPVQFCYLNTTGEQCGPFGTSGFGGIFNIGPWFSPFGIDWSASLSPTPYAAPPSSVIVPSVVGDSQSAASAAIGATGLILGTVTSQSSAAVAAGAVISQSPAGGASVADGSTVNLVVSSGPAPDTVPNVVGDTQAAAASALGSAGLTLGTITTQSSTSVANGAVISETPAAGTNVTAGSSVALVVSGGPLPGDINLDGEVDKLDLAYITSALNTPASGPNDPRDLNHDGVINALDARILITLCTHPGCVHE